VSVIVHFREPLLYSYDEACEALRVTRAGLEKLLAAGDIRGIWVNRRRRIVAASLRQFVDRAAA